MSQNKQIKELSNLQQQIANFSTQRQQLVNEKNEYEDALKHLDSTEKSYKIIGNIMISRDKEELKKDVKKRLEMVDVKIKSFEKQENQLKEKADELQGKVMSGMKKEE